MRSHGGNYYRDSHAERDSYHRYDERDREREYRGRDYRHEEQRYRRDERDTYRRREEPRREERRRDEPRREEVRREEPRRDEPRRDPYAEMELLRMRNRALNVARKLTETILRRPFDENANAQWRLGEALLKLKLQADSGNSVIPSQSKGFSNRINVPVDENPDFNYLGLLIGPRGETQKRFQSESGARIVIRGRGSSKDGNDELPDEPLHVFISADNEEAVRMATDLVEDLLFNKEHQAKLKNQQLMKIAELSGKRAPGFVLSESLYANEAKDAFFARGNAEVAEQVRVPRDRVGHIIGKGGDTIRMLQTKTGAFIQVAKEDVFPDADFKIIEVEGSAEEVKFAKEEIQRLLDEFDQKRSRLTINVPDGHDYLAVEVPNDAVGILIGKAGQTIRQIIAKTGAHVQVQKDSECAPNSATRIVHVHGLTDNVEIARREIMLLVQQHEQQRQHLQLQSNMESGFVEKEIRIPGTTVGYVIGRGGETIKSIQLRLQTKVTIDKEDDSNGDRHIQIRGLPPNVDAVYSEILSIVKQYDRPNQFRRGANAVNPVQASTAYVDPYLYLNSENPESQTVNAQTAAVYGDPATMAAQAAAAAAGQDPNLYYEYYQQYWQYYSSMSSQSQGSYAVEDSTASEEYAPPPPE